MAASGHSTRFAPDRGLTGRMVTTMFLIGLVYVGFTGLLIALLGRAWPIVVVVSGALFVAQFWFSDKIAERAMGAREATPEQYPQLHGAVDRICALADMPKPRIAVAVNSMPNAFATGRKPEHAVLCVTTGLLNRLEPAELEGVLAHELSHIAHRDVAVMTIAGFLGVLAGAITRIGLWGGFRGGGRDSNTAIIAIAIPLASMLVYALSVLLTRLLSRYRELAADRSAALLTGRPSELASALTKVTGRIAAIPTEDLRRAQPYNAFYFAPALSPKDAASQLFSTHPTLEKRLEQLARISAELGR